MMRTKWCEDCEHNNTITCEGCKWNRRYIDKFKPRHSLATTACAKETNLSDMEIDPSWNFFAKGKGKMNLYFQRSNGEEIKIAQVDTEEEIWWEIVKFLFTPLHLKFVDTRAWTDNGRTWYDVRGHTESFFVDKELKIGEKGSKND